ncbi:peptidoglycan recognition protein 1-like [Macrosteles quadrilineatus]|uniref:peptidoglycan recognition protein 1-like n=1 Tax=Macrosteles quadrilineatus TaxID=74068 RepID=UPI0023E19F52|nr:peptidoglycan recognition protein 1-like [Macrosteles quadrilineatus]
MATTEYKYARHATPEEAAKILGMGAGTWPPPPGYPTKPKYEEFCHDIPIVPRSEWGALPPRHVDHVEEAEVTHVIINHTRTRTCSDPESCVLKMQYIQKKHLDQGLPDIKYNFLVGGDGRVYEGRGWTVSPHVNQQWPEVTKMCVEFAYIGNYGRFHRPKRPGRKLVGPMWDLIEFGYVKDYIAYGLELHQRRHWPRVINFISDDPVFGVDWNYPAPHT